MSYADATYDSIITVVLATFPEIRPEYEKESSRWLPGEMGPYNLFDIVLMPYLHALLERGDDEAHLRRIFSFFEDLIESPDARIRDLIGVAVCEDLCSREAGLQRAVSYMGPKLKRSCDAYLK